MSEFWLRCQSFSRKQSYIPARYLGCLFSKFLFNIRDSSNRKTVIVIENALQQWKIHMKCRASAECAFETDSTAMLFDNFFRNIETQPRATNFPGV